MDYDLYRIDYAICGITYPDTMKILPAAEKLHQKFTVGDKNGVLQCLSIKDEEPIVHFKTLPGKSITSLQLASSDGGNQPDKIFAASGNEVKGYTRKGKVFLNIETAVSETITSIHFAFILINDNGTLRGVKQRYVLGSDLILCSGRTVTYYRELRELHSYICEDRVLDIAAFAAPNSTRVRLLILIANKGAAILDNGQLISKTTETSGPCRLAVPPTLHNTDIYSFYGAADGSIGVIYYLNSTLTTKCLIEGKGLGPVVCTGWFYNNVGAHLAVGRHDGSIQLYLVDLEILGEKPRLKYTYFCGEPVTSVCGGCIGTDENELLVATFSGRIFGLRSSRFMPGGGGLANIPLNALASRRMKLQAEISRLEKQTANERDKYQKNTRSIQAGLSMPPLLDIQYEPSGVTKEGWQETRIISAVPLDMIFVYCNRKLHLLTDSATVLSICSSEGIALENNACLATIRCQAGTRRLWIKMKCTESETSIVESVRVMLYFLPAGAPRVARLITLKLPAMPQYSQHEDLDLDIEKRCICEVQVAGSFSVAEMNSWLADILPGELPRPSNCVAFARRHNLLGTILISRYQRGLAVFKSDNVTTIATIRNILSNYSVLKNNRVEISCDIPDDCCVKSFEGLMEQFKAEHRKYKDAFLKQAISNLDIVNEDMNNETPILCSDYTRVWNTPQESLESNFNELNDIILQWHLDWKTLSFQTRPDPSNIKLKLQNALKHCHINEIKTLLSE